MFNILLIWPAQEKAKGPENNKLAFGQKENEPAPTGEIIKQRHIGQTNSGGSTRMFNKATSVIFWLPSSPSNELIEDRATN